MKNWFVVLILALTSCSKDPVVEVPTNTLTSAAEYTVGSSTRSYNNYLVESVSGFNLVVYNIPSTSPQVKIQVRPLLQTDSIHVKSQNLQVTYIDGTKTYIADATHGEGYIKCLINLNSEVNVTIRDGSGNLKAALKREENFDARFYVKVVNQAAPFDEVIITNGKLTRKGKYYVY